MLIMEYFDPALNIATWPLATKINMDQCSTHKSVVHAKTGHVWSVAVVVVFLAKNVTSLHPSCFKIFACLSTYLILLPNRIFSMYLSSF